MREGQFVSAKVQENRLVRLKRLLNKLKNPQEHNTLWLFSELENFDRDQKFKRKNGRLFQVACWQDAFDVFRVIHIEFPTNGMNLDAVNCQGHAKPLHFLSGL